MRIFFSRVDRFNLNEAISALSDGDFGGPERTVCHDVELGLAFEWDELDPRVVRQDSYLDDAVGVNVNEKQQLVNALCESPFNIKALRLTNSTKIIPGIFNISWLDEQKIQNSSNKIWLKTDYCPLGRQWPSKENRGDVVAPLIARILREKHSIKDLKVPYNYIGPDGAQIIAEALKENRALEALDLSYNTLGDDGFKQIISVVCSHPSLKELHVESNYICDQGAALIGEYFGSGTHVLERVYLSGNYITQTGLDYLREISERTGITFLIDGNSLSEPVESKVEEKHSADSVNDTQQTVVQEDEDDWYNSIGSPEHEEVPDVANEFKKAVDDGSDEAVKQQTMNANKKLPPVRNHKKKTTSKEEKPEVQQPLPVSLHAKVKPYLNNVWEILGLPKEEFPVTLDEALGKVNQSLQGDYKPKKRTLAACMLVRALLAECEITADHDKKQQYFEMALGQLDAAYDAFCEIKQELAKNEVKPQLALLCLLMSQADLYARYSAQPMRYETQRLVWRAISDQLEVSTESSSYLAVLEQLNSVSPVVETREEKSIAEQLGSGIFGSSRPDDSKPSAPERTGLNFGGTKA